MNLIKQVYTVQCKNGRYYYCQEKKLAGKKSKIEENNKKLYFKETKQNCDKTSKTEVTTCSIQVYIATRIEGR